MSSQYFVSSNRKITAWITLFLYLFMSMSFMWSPLAGAKSAVSNHEQVSAVPSTQKVSEQTTRVAELAQTLAENPSGEVIRQLAEKKLNNLINLHAAEWLNQFAQAQIGLNLQTKGGMIGGHADLLLPLFDRDETLLYTQLGAREHGGRWTGNAGLGARFLTDSYLVGLNTFYDNDFTGSNRRIGLGAEYARHYLKFAVNGYWRLNDWHQSRDFADYRERPANGYDVRLEGWLPHHPHLGAALTYERYYGKEVALFSKDTRQRDPRALAAEIKYRPIPLVTLSVGQRVGTDNHAETHFNMLVNYRLGEDLTRQLAGNHVAATRDLHDSRFDLVNRNHRITLDYQESVAVTLVLPQDLQVKSAQPLTVASVISSTYPIRRVAWDLSALLAAGGKCVKQQANSVQIIAPSYRPDASDKLANRYPISATAVDVKGNRSPRATTTIEVLNASVSIANVDITKDNALADGRDPNEVMLSLALSDGTPAQAVPVRFSTASQATLSPQAAQSDEQGKVVLHVTNTQATAVAIQAQVDDQQTDFLLHFIANPATARISALTVINDGATANGVAENRVKGRIVDATGNPVAHEEVYFAAAPEFAQHVKFLPEQTKSDSEGYFYVSLTSNKAGKCAIDIRANDATAVLETTFVADVETVTLYLDVVENNAVANNHAKNRVRVKVMDRDANPVDNQLVTLSADNGAQLTATEVTTNAAGYAEFGLFSARAGKVTVTAKLGSLIASTAVDFISDSDTATINQPVVLVNSALANGKAKNSVKSIITDQQGNPVAGVTVKFDVDSGVTLVDTQSTSNEQGEVFTALTSEKAVNANVTLTLQAQSQQTQVQFIADASTAILDLLIVDDNRIANGVAQNNLQITVVDKNSNPLSEQIITIATEGSAIPSVYQITTNAQGSAAFGISSIQAGQTTVTVKLGEQQMTTTVNFIGDSSTATIKQFAAIANGALANGEAQDSVRGIIADKFGNPLAGIPVQFAADSGVVLVDTQAISNALGEVATALTSKKAVSAQVTLTLQAQSQQTQVQFIADADSATLTLTATENNRVADGTAENRLRIKVMDKYANPLPKQIITISADNNAYLPTTQVTTDIAGQAKFGVSSTKAGQATVTIRSGEQITTAVVNFIGDSSTATISQFVVTENGALANGTAQNAVKGVIVDKFGNPLAAIPVQFVADNDVMLVDTRATSNTLGEVATALISEKAVSANIKLILQAQSKQTQVQFIANADSATLVLSVTEDNHIADDAAENKLRVKVVDKYANPLPNQTITVMVDNGAHPTIPQVVTDAEGIALLAVASAKAGPVTVTVALGEQLATATVNFIADAATAKIKQFVVTADGALADGQQRNSVQGVITDKFDNPLANVTVELTADVGVTLVATQAVSNEDGEVSTALTSENAGSANIKLQLHGLTEQVQVNFIADADTAMLDVTLIEDHHIADGIAQNRVQVNVADKYANPLANQAITISAKDGATPSTHQVITDTQGAAVFGVFSNKAGSATIVVTLGAQVKEITVHFIGDSATAVASQFRAIQDGALADGTAKSIVKALIVDKFANPVAGVAVKFAVDNGATLVDTQAISNASGEVSTALTSKKAVSVNVALTLKEHVSQIPVQFVADASTAALTLTVVDNDCVADDVAQNRVRISVVDELANPVADQLIMLSAEQDVHLSAAQVTTDVHGQAQFSASSSIAKSAMIVAKMGEQIKVATVTFVGDSATAYIDQFVITANAALADGKDKNSVKGVIVDKYHNPVVGVTVEFTADSNVAFVDTAAITDEHGEVSTALTSKTAESTTVTLSLQGQTQQAQVQFIADVGGAVLNDPAVVNDKSVANGTAQNNVRVTVVDEGGNPVPNQAIGIAVDNGAIPSVSQAKTDTQGSVLFGVSSTRAGSAIITVKMGEQTKTVEVNFIADITTATIKQLTVVADGALADGKGKNIVKGMIVDKFNNPVTDIVVVFTVDDATATLVDTQATSNVYGEVKTALTSEKAINTLVTLTLQAQSERVPVQFVADASTASVNLAVLSDNCVANDIAQNKVRVQVVDKYANPLPNQIIAIAADNDAHLLVSQVTTDAQGVAEFAVTSTKAGQATVTIIAGEQTKAATVNFVGDDTTATITQFIASANGALADGKAQNSVKGTIVDKFGNPLAGIAVRFAADSEIVFVDMQAMSNALGEVSTALTSEKAVSVPVTLTLQAQSKQTQVQFIADASTANLDLSVIEDNRVADDTAQNRLRVNVVDKLNNPLPNQIITITADNAAHLATLQVTTDTAGQAEFGLSSTKAGPATVTIKAGERTETAVVNFIGDPTTATISQCVVTANGAVADGKAQNSVKGMIVDKFGNPLAGIAMQFTADSGVALVATQAVSNDAGEVSTALTSEKAANASVTLTLQAQSIQTQVQFIADASTAILDLSVIENNRVADNTAQNTLQVKVADKFANPLSNQIVAISADNGAHLAATQVTTDAVGQAQFGLSSTRVGQVIVTIKLGEQTKTAAVNFIGDSASATIKQFTVAADQALADGQARNSVQGIIVDKFGHPLAGISVQFTGDSDVALVDTRATSNALGEVSTALTSKKAVRANITLTLQAQSKQTPVQFIADASTASLDLTVTQDNRVADATAENRLRINVVDKYANPLPNQRIAIAADNDAHLTTSQVTTDVAGQAEFGLSSTKAGQATVTITLGEQTKAAVVHFIGDSATATISQFIVTGNGAVADGEAQNSVKGTIVDKFGNPLAGIPTQFIADSGVTLVATQGISNAMGEVSTALTSEKAGSANIKLSLEAETSEVQVAFVADANTATLAVTLVEDRNVANGIAQNTGRIKVVDKQANPVPSQLITLSANNSAQPVVAEITTDINGEALFQVTSNKAGETRVTVTLGEQVKTIAMHFIGDSATAQIGQFVATADRALADGKAKNRVEGVIVDKFNNPVAGVAVTFVADNGVTLVDEQAVSNEDGAVAVALTNTRALAATVTLTMNTLSKAVQIQFVADRRTAKFAENTLAVIEDNAQADGVARNGIRGRIVDALGNAVAGEQIGIAVDNAFTEHVQIYPAQTVSDSDGWFSTELSCDKYGEFGIVVTVNGITTTLENRFIPGFVTFRLDVLDNEGVADDTLRNRVRITAKDKNGKPMQNRAITIELSDDSVSYSPQPVVTDANGESEIRLKSTKAVSVFVTAKAAELADTTTVSFIANAQTAAIDEASFILPARAAVDTAVPFSIAVKDAFDNPVPNVTVDLAATNGAELRPMSGVTDASGRLTASVVGKTYGHTEVTASVNQSSVQRETVFLQITGFSNVNIQGTPTQFDVTQGFPTTAIKDATFTISVNEGQVSASDFVWVAYPPEINIDRDGTVLFTTEPSASAITITGQDSQRNTLGYTLNLKLWAVHKKTFGEKTFEQAAVLCQDSGARLPAVKEATLGSNIRGVGALIAEWGALPFVQKFWSADHEMMVDATSGEEIAVGLAINPKAAVLCVKDLRP